MALSVPTDLIRSAYLGTPAGYLGSYLILLLGACESSDPPPVSPPGGSPNPLAVRVHRFQISQHPFLIFPLTQPELQRVLTETASVIAQNHRAPTEACPVAIEQVGPILKLPADAPSVVRSNNDFNRLERPGLGGEDPDIRAVHVVQGINWCGGNSPNIIGCANIPGRAIVVVRQPDITTEGQLWGHEFGHNRGLDHVSNPARLMNPVLMSTAKDLVPNECQSYRGPEPLVTAQTSRFPSPATAATNDPQGDILAFVRQIRPHGAADLITAAARFGAADVEKIMPLLNDPAERKAWANIVLTAGAAGDPATAGSLIAFLFDRNRDPTDIAAEQARQQVPIALGFLAQRSDNKTAMTFLLRHGQPGAWRTYTPRTLSIGAATGMERLMASQTIEGLVMSGRPAAIAQLEADLNALRNTGRLTLPGSVRGATSDDTVRESEMLTDALQRAGRVQSEGLGAAYRRE